MSNIGFVCELNKCTGCGACLIACPTNAISMKTDSLGFYYPLIDDSKCIKCKKCQLVCPNNSLIISKNDFQECYVAESRNKLSPNSTSGGIATTLAHIWTKNKGVIYASSFDNEQHKFIFKRYNLKNINSFYKFASGSKYIQTNIWEIFSDLKRDIKQKVSILIIGTPCQIAGIRMVFGNPVNLYTIDLLCHGVPSQKMLFDNFNKISFDKVDNVLFREGNRYRLKLLDYNGLLVYNKSPFDNYFLEGFQSNMTLRESCYSCKYSSSSRIGDLSLGDYWGLHQSILSNYSHPSLILVNNVKGRELFEILHNHIVYLKREINEAQSGNECLRKSASPHKNRKKFERLYEKNSFVDSVKKSRTLKKKIQHFPILQMLVRKKYGYYK